MALKSITYQFKGMNRDLSNINANELFAYEISNMRITQDKDNTLLSITSIQNDKDTDITLQGIPIGQAVVANNWVIFCTSPRNNTEVGSTIYDYIYVIYKDGDYNLNVKSVRGFLNFNPEHPIETVVYYENEGILKIYWVDGINLLRFITVDRIKNELDINSYEVDAVPNMSAHTDESLEITKDNDSIGIFPVGTTLYAFTYFNKYGLQSNIFKISSLYYNTGIDKGLSANKTSTNCYRIKLTNLNTQYYDYVRIYSIVKSSVTPEVKVVANIKINKNTLSIEFLDRNNTGYIIDPTELLYVGGELLIVQTLTQKDNTLFLGNIEKNNFVVNPTIREYCKRLLPSITFLNNSIDKYCIYEDVSGYSYYRQFLLNNNSEKITTFKKGEYYRFGIQLQDSSGKWSSPIFIGDKQCDKSVKSERVVRNYSTQTRHLLVKARISINDIDNNNKHLTALKNTGAIKIRPIIVYPELVDRSVLCQGYLCPTVYNIGERCNNGIYAQSSWFARPFTSDLYCPLEPLMNLDNYNSNDELNTGSAIEFRHNAYIGGYGTDHMEIQGADRWGIIDDGYDTNTQYTLNPVTTLNKVTSYKEEHSHLFFVDNSIVTFHSPEIEFDDSLKTTDLSNYKLRIIGVVPLTGNLGDIDLITSTPATMFTPDEEDGYKPLTGNTNYDHTGFYKKIRSSVNYSANGHKILCSGYFYRRSWKWENDYLYNVNVNGTSQKMLPSENIKIIVGHLITPFHAEGFIEDNDTGGKLLYKRISNVRYSYGNTFNIGLIELPIEDIKLYDSELATPIILKLKESKNIQYSGNIDKILTCVHLEGNPATLKPGSYRFMSPQINVSKITISQSGNNFIEEATIQTPDESLNKWLPWNPIKATTNPIIMRYKSSPHIVINLQKNGINEQILPVVNGNRINDFWSASDSEQYYPWDTSKPLPLQYTSVSVGDFGGLFLAELYLDLSSNANSLFGGLSDEAIANNRWHIAGPEVALNDDYLVVLEYLEGDTYYQRYDNLKTYPWSLEESNGITDVISFMVETRINLDGRYDNNIPNTPMFHIFPNNFNLINKDYTQKRDFFSTYGIDYSDVLVLKYPNIITWSKTKNSGEDVDTWLNHNLASTLELDGTAGEITSLLRYNDTILAFQNKALNAIKYNENVLISTQQGIPIELANSGKVTGYYTISNNIGCSNKWSICKTLEGIYFIDGYNKSFFLYGLNGLQNLSKTKGLDTYFRNLDTISLNWNPREKEGIKVNYDPLNKEILLLTKSYETLVYSEQLLLFTSFYTDYLNCLNSLQGTLYSLRSSLNSLNSESTTVLKEYLNGDNCEEFYIDFISNPEPLKDKIFNAIEFRSDSYTDNIIQHFKTFNKFSINNEYLHSGDTLEYNTYGLSNLKKKFRIWKYTILRASDPDHPYDRIRNTWAKIHLGSVLLDIKTILHDITVHYSV